MKITEIKTTYLRIPVESALVNSTKSVAYMEVVPVEINTDEGINGYGYTYTDGFGGHAIKSLIDTDIRSLILEKDPMDVRNISSFLLWELRQAGFAGITVLGVAAIDLALWDIYSQYVKLPIVKIIGQYRDKIPTYGSVAGWSKLPVEEMVERAKLLVEEIGLIGIKIQVGRLTPEGDVERLSRLRDALGDNVKLFVDANTILDVPTAINLGTKIQEYDISWFEEPLPLRDPVGHKMLSRAINIPLATGENFFGIHDCDEYIRDRLVSYIQADVIRVGGITEWMRIASYCDSQGLKISPHFLMEITTHVQCCVPNSLFVEYIPWFQKLFVEPIKVEKGYSYPRTNPGLGLKFTDEAIDQYAME